jgi:hypothetical protein
LWAFDAFNKIHFLKLSGPQTARVNQSVILVVTDGTNGSPMQGADVDGQMSNINGQVTFMFSTVGVKRLKARKADCIRSHELTINR